MNRYNIHNKVTKARQNIEQKDYEQADSELKKVQESIEQGLLSSLNNTNEK